MKKFLAFLLIFTMIFAVPVFGQLSRQEVSGVLLEVMEGVNSQAGFNFANFVERAGLTHDDVVQIIMVEMADDMELLMQHYGDDWLVYAIHDFIIYFMEELEWEGTAAAVELLTSYHRNASGWTPTDDISPEDVSKALTDIAERLRVEEGFDFAEILEEAGLTHDDVVNIFWMILTIPGEGEWFVDQYGDDWLEYALLYFLEESQGEAEQGMDAAVRHLLFAHVIYGIMDVLGHENAEDFLSSPLLFSFADEDEDALISALADEHFFITFERLVSQYGVDGFMEIFDVDPLEAFIAYIMGEHVPAVVYLDEMLGGLVAETLESYAEYFEVIMSLDDILEAGSDIVIDADLNFDYELYEELFMFHDTILAYEETVITADELEQLFYFET
ncbi:MAG: hypothetical protein FWF80_01385, partial [Defluviitaleaceae bacterium]|nr:hypothetical protein [Defluviitaleaceae bacterium]